MPNYTKYTLVDVDTKVAEQEHLAFACDIQDEVTLEDVRALLRNPYITAISYLKNQKDEFEPLYIRYGQASFRSGDQWKLVVPEMPMVTIVLFERFVKHLPIAVYGNFPAAVAAIKQRYSFAEMVGMGSDFAERVGMGSDADIVYVVNPALYYMADLLVRDKDGNGIQIATLNRVDLIGWR